MSYMTRYYVKSALKHPVLGAKALCDTVFNGETRLRDNFKMRVKAWEFAREHNYSKEELAELNRTMAVGVKFFTLVGKGDAFHSMLFVTEVSEGSVACYVARARRSEKFPQRVDTAAAVFEDREFIVHIKSAIAHPGTASSGLIRAIACGVATTGSDFFNKPIFGMG